MIEASSATGFGSLLVNTTIERLGGSIAHDWKPVGLHVRIDMPSPVLKV
ncbi:hypothetical protein [Bradyrhizobium sp.]